MNQPAKEPADEQPSRQMDLSPEVLDQWELELEQFANEISQRLAIVRSAAEPSHGESSMRQGRVTGIPT